MVETHAENRETFRLPLSVPGVYCFAIDYMGMTPCTMVPNLPVTLETENMEPWQPKEAGRVEYDGVLHPLRWGLARSRNNYSAWIMKQAKDPQAVADFIRQMGIHSYIDRKSVV